MRLEKYLKEMCVNRNEFCKKVGVSYPTITNILQGLTDPRLSIALKIEEITEGKVTCKELVNPIYLKNLELKSKALSEKKRRKKQAPRSL